MTDLALIAFSWLLFGLVAAMVIGNRLGESTDV